MIAETTYTIPKGGYYAELVWNDDKREHYHYELRRVDEPTPLDKIGSIMPNDSDTFLFWNRKSEMIKWAEGNKHNPRYFVPAIVELINKLKN